MSDNNGEVCEAYGVIKPKKMYGKEYMGIERTTFVIDEKGVIKSIYRKVNVKNHGDIVLEYIKAL